jgi:hypothetical protein
VQALELYVQVQLFEVLIKRRKGERLIRIDWHPLVPAFEPPLSEAGLGLERTRFACDDKLHLVAPASWAPCGSCGKAFFLPRCHPAACLRCGGAIKGGMRVELKFCNAAATLLLTEGCPTNN